MVIMLGLVDSVEEATLSEEIVPSFVSCFYRLILSIQCAAVIENTCGTHRI